MCNSDEVRDGASRRRTRLGSWHFSTHLYLFFKDV
ncbi:hypothetical protein LINPERPRIM_LOCUS20116 [Linum perenne]